MSYTKELKYFWNLIWNPDSGAKRQLDVGNALRLYYTLAILPFIAYLVIGGIMLALGHATSGVGGDTVFAPLYAMAKSFSYVSLFWNAIVLFFVALPIGIAIDAMIYQVIGKFFLKAWNGDYAKTFTAVTLSVFPVLFLAWIDTIPVLNTIFIVLVPIWSIVVFVTVLAAQQKLTRLNAMLMLLIKSLLVFFVVVLLGISLLSSIAYALTSGLVPAGTVFMHWFNATHVAATTAGSQWGMGTPITEPG